MRAIVSALFVLTCLSQAACGKPSTKPDPTKPIPWITKPKDPAATVTERDLSVAETVDVDVPFEAGRAAYHGPCNVPRGYEDTTLADLLASPETHGDRKIQIAGWLGARVSFIAPAVEGVPVCKAHVAYELTEDEADGLLGEPEPRLDLRGETSIQDGSNCASLDVPDADRVVVWGTTSPSGTEIWIDGICAADEIPCASSAHCPAAMVCGAYWLCDLP